MARFASGLGPQNIHIPSYSNLRVFQAQMLIRKKLKVVQLFIILKLYDTQISPWNLTEQIEKT